MKDSRLGDFLWYEWDGDLNPESSLDSGEGFVLYYTEDWVEIENDIVKRALASALQKDGVVSSLGDGFKFIDQSYSNLRWSYAGFVDETLTQCDEMDETFYGDIVEESTKITFMKIYI